MSLQLIPMTLAEANTFVSRHHRHHKPVPGTKFAIGAASDDEVVGIVLVGRPVARHFDNGWTLEVNRCCTDGHKNACSFLYAAAWRAAKAMGFKRLITYTLPAEGGSSLRAAGWTNVGLSSGGNWNCKGRPRVDTSEEMRQQKFRWESPL